MTFCHPFDFAILWPAVYAVWCKIMQCSFSLCIWHWILFFSEIC